MPRETAQLDSRGVRLYALYAQRIDRRGHREWQGGGQQYFAVTADTLTCGASISAINPGTARHVVPSRCSWYYRVRLRDWTVPEGAYTMDHSFAVMYHHYEMKMSVHPADKFAATRGQRRCPRRGTTVRPQAVRNTNNCVWTHRYFLTPLMIF